MVRLWAWLIVLPTVGPLPQISHFLDIISLWFFRISDVYYTKDWYKKQQGKHLMLISRMDLNAPILLNFEITRCSADQIIAIEHRFPIVLDEKVSVPEGVF